VNQLLNQRFLLTTAAITVFGAFSSWMIPKDPTQNVPVIGKLIFAGAAFLHLFLLLLFLWNRFLANLQSNIMIYLVLTGTSKWETDWKQFRGKPGILSTGFIQSCVFLTLGVLTLLWPFVISCACNLPLGAGWVLFEVVIAAAYFITVFGFGIKQWLRNDEQTKTRWQEVLRTPPPTEESVHADR
jgi:hypothetical protein